MAGTGASTRTFNQNPTSFDPSTAPTSGPGAFVQDFTGAVPGLGYIARVAGVLTLIPLAAASALPVADAITVTPLSSGSNNRRLRFALVNAQSAPTTRPGVLTVSLSGAALASVDVGTPASDLFTYVGGTWAGRAAGALVEVTVTGQPGITVAYTFQTTGPNGASVAGSATIPA